MLGTIPRSSKIICRVILISSWIWIAGHWLNSAPLSRSSKPVKPVRMISRNITIKLIRFKNSSPDSKNKRNIRLSKWKKCSARRSSSKSCMAILLTPPFTDILPWRKNLTFLSSMFSITCRRKSLQSRSISTPKLFPIISLKHLIFDMRLSVWRLAGKLLAGLMILCGYGAILWWLIEGCPFHQSQKKPRFDHLMRSISNTGWRFWRGF